MKGASYWVYHRPWIFTWWADIFFDLPSKLLLTTSLLAFARLYKDRIYLIISGTEIKSVASWNFPQLSFSEDETARHWDEQQNTCSLLIISCQLRESFWKKIEAGCPPLRTLKKCFWKKQNILNDQSLCENFLFLSPLETMGLLRIHVAGTRAIEEWVWCFLPC